MISLDQPAPDLEYPVAGLSAPVEVLVDEWGVPHLYAGSTHDVFLDPSGARAPAYDGEHPDNPRRVEKALTLSRYGRPLPNLPLPLANLLGGQGLFLLRRR